MKKFVRFLLIGIILLCASLFIGVNNIAPYAILQPQRISEELKPENLGLISEPLSILTKDHIRLNGYWVSPKADSRGVMIMVHGVGGCKEHFLGLAEKLAHKGVASILFDSRAHGKSEGEYCTYGFYEKKDIAEIVNEIKSREPHLPIGIWGNSLGGAIAIQALEYDKRIQFGIIESTFTNLSQIVLDYGNNMLGYMNQTLSDYALKRAGDIAQFPPDEVKPIESVQHIEQAMFLAHGDADQNISHVYGQQLFDNLTSIDKEFYLVKGGGHLNLFSKGGKAYEDKLMAFIERNLNK